MAVVISINGVDQTANVALDAGVTITRRLNERSRATFTTLPGYMPARGESVFIKTVVGETEVYYFGGVVLRRSVSAAGSLAFCAVECVDWLVYADHTYYTGTLGGAGVSLKDALTALVADGLDDYGISVHTSQADGPDIASTTYGHARVTDVLRDLCSQTGSTYLMSMSVDKELRFVDCYAEAATWTLTDASPSSLVITWEDGEKLPATDAVIACGPPGTSETITQTWTQAASATSWAVDIPASTTAVQPSVVVVGGVTKTIAIPPDSAQYLWTPSTGTLSTGTDPAPSNGTAISLTYPCLYPFTVSATTSATPSLAVSQARTDIKDVPSGQALCNALLASASIARKRVHIASDTSGWDVGQVVDLDSTILGLDDVFVITDVTLTMATGTYWTYAIDGENGTAYGGSDLDALRAT